MAAPTPTATPFRKSRREIGRFIPSSQSLLFIDSCSVILAQRFARLICPVLSGTGHRHPTLERTRGPILHRFSHLEPLEVWRSSCDNEARWTLPAQNSSVKN